VNDAKVRVSCPYLQENDFTKNSHFQAPLKEISQKNHKNDYEGGKRGGKFFFHLLVDERNNPIKDFPQFAPR
jgi:hypothetical protein